MNKLFVYGTLAPGRANEAVLKDVPGSWQRATLEGELREQGWGAALGCPGIVPVAGGEEVEGFLFSSAQLAELWAMLDTFEGDGYRRVPVQVRLESGTRVEAFVYALNLAD